MQRKKPPTAEEVAKAEYEEHVRRSIPMVDSDRRPLLTEFVIDYAAPTPSITASSQTKLTEFALGCRSRLEGSRLPILFTSDQDKPDSPSGHTIEDAEMCGFIDGIDTINLTNWGYSDGHTAIALPMESGSVANPFSITRCGNGPSKYNFNGFMPDVVFISPGAERVWGTVAASQTCSFIEFVCTYDRRAMCVVKPPLGRTALRSKEIKERFSDLHIVVRLAAPPTAENIAAIKGITTLSEFYQTPGPLEYHGVYQAPSDVNTESPQPSNSASPQPPPTPYSQKQGATSAYNFLIAPPFGSSVVGTARLSDFAKVVGALSISNTLMIVISDPRVLAHPENAAAGVLQQLREWYSNAMDTGSVGSVPSSQTDASQQSTSGDVNFHDRFIEMIGHGIVPPKEMGSAWNYTATELDVVNLLKVATARQNMPTRVAASVWAIWRMYSGGRVVTHFNTKPRKFSAIELWRQVIATGCHELVSGRLFHFVLISAIMEKLVDQ